MATLPFSLNWEGGTNGADVTASTETVLTSVTGTKGVYGNTSPVEGSLCCKWDFPTSGQGVQIVTFTGVATVWFGLYIRLRTAAATTPTLIASWFNGATKVGDLRINTNNTLQIRDGGNTVITPASGALNVSTTLWDRIAIGISPGSSTGHKLRTYLGANRHGTTPDDSIDGAATFASQTAVTEIRLGLAGAATIAYDLDRGRFDTSEPAPLAGGSPVANAGPDQPGVTQGSLVQLAGSASGGAGAPYTYLWRVISGTATLSSMTAQNPTFTAGTVGTVTLGLKVTDSASVQSSEDTVVITVSAVTATDFMYLTGGLWRPCTIATLRSGAWS